MGTIHISNNGKSVAASITQGETISSALAKQGITIPTPCGGNGTCKKCTVETSDGVKLACQTPATDNMTIYPPQIKDESLAIQDTYESPRPFVTEHNIERKAECKTEHKLNNQTDTNHPSTYGIAIDIGTTTLAFELWRITTGKQIASLSRVNNQRILGTDVITRIKQATEGHQAQLHRHIIDDICQGISQLLESVNRESNTQASDVHKHTQSKPNIQLTDISNVTISGNTTMLHLLRNLPCDTLGVSPFTPVDINLMSCNFNEVFDDNLHLNATLTLLPGISTFVGADIAAGILCCDTNAPLPSLLIDLGTNGEMALFSQKEIIVTSTAAGPAFEAGNISNGVASIPGAIAKLCYLPKDNVFIYETIASDLITSDSGTSGSVKSKPPVGLCGTGVMDAAAQLITHNLADETGRLQDPYFDKGVLITKGTTKDIIFTQKDMREVQLAKSAVRSGIEILLETAGYGYNDIGSVFLAGGFGHKINIESAQTLGLIPKELASKVITVGNTSLAGAAHVLLSTTAKADILAITSRAKEINLSTHPRFNDLFMEYMLFE